MPKSAAKSAAPQAPAVPVPHRLANLVQLLLRYHEGISMVEIAKLEGYDDKRFGRGPAASADEEKERLALRRRFQRDLKALSDIGVQVEQLKARADDKGDLYRMSLDSTLLKGIRLEPEEHVLLHSLQHAFPDLSETDFGGLVLSALVKLKSGGSDAAGEQPRTKRQMQRALAGGKSQLPQLDACLYAFASRKPIRFKYLGSNDASAKKRIVEPWGVVRRGTQGYLVGLDREKNEQRIFRLSRMQGMPEVLEKEAEFTLPAGFKLEDAFPASPFSGGGKSSANMAKGVRVKFDTDVGFMIANDFEGEHQVKLAKDGSAELKIAACWPDELFRYLAEYAGHFEIMAPKTLVDAFQSRLQATLKRYV